ncbi:MAG TPA: thioredoxin [Bacteroidia bacterium]|nr:thioredoxin [Bacteroidia bacterium]
MKTLFCIFPFVAVLSMTSCGDSSSKTVLSDAGAETFDSLIAALPDEQILDVRTPEEFNEGHLEGAQNIDFKGADFAIHVNALDKSKPVMVYCHSGNRSAQAADQLRNNGFTTVYALDGGIQAWQSAGKKVIVPDVSHTTDGPVSLAQYNKIIADNDVVLVDFTATWCGPCKMLAPSLHELETEMAGKFVLLKVDVDRDRPVAQNMNIAAMPTLVLYKKGEVQWRNEGLVPKDMIAEKITGAQ